MKLLLPILAGFVILTMTETTVLADLPPVPGQPYRRNLPPFVVPKANPSTKAAFLVIDATTQNGIRVVLPAKLVKDLQTAMAQADAPRQTARLPWSSIMVGLALAMALACVGLGIVRSKQRMTFAALVCLAGTTMLAGLGCPNSQIFVPNNPVSIKAAKERDGKSNGTLEGTANLEVRSDTDKVQVYVDKDDMKSFIERTELPTKP